MDAGELSSDGGLGHVLCQTDSLRNKCWDWAKRAMVYLRSQWKNATSYISKQKMLQPSSHHNTAGQWWAPRRVRMRTNRILDPDGWVAYQRMISMSQGKSAEFLDMRCLAFLYYWKSFDVLTTWSLLQKTPISCFTYFPLRAISSSSLRGCVPGLSPQFGPLNKPSLSTVRLYIFFSQEDSSYISSVSALDLAISVFFSNGG